jgi:hypothetical protein
VPRSDSAEVDPASTYRAIGLNAFPGPAAADIGVLRCLDRLEAVLVEEQRALQDMSPAVLRSINARKSALLLELDRGQRSLKSSIQDPATVQRLRDIRPKLEQSMKQISLHVAALNEVLGVVRRSVAGREADGTYSRTAQTDEWIK